MWPISGPEIRFSASKHSLRFELELSAEEVRSTKKANHHFSHLDGAKSGKKIKIPSDCFVLIFVMNLNADCSHTFLVYFLSMKVTGNAFC
jgi:hypothetical protein